MSILATEELSKNFGGQNALDDVDVSVEKGEIVGLIGSNGAGKSTLFNCITGLNEPDGGKVFFRGDDVTGWTVTQAAQTGVVKTFQDTKIYGDMSVRRNLVVSAPGSGVLRPPSDELNNDAQEMLNYIDLEVVGDVMAGSLSYGQQKLLELGMALMADPEVLLMDEPASGINPTMINNVKRYIRDAREERGLTFFIIEHNMEFVMDIADRIYALGHGEKIAEGTPEEIQTDEAVLESYLGE
ncbi:MAG: ABC transporter ATP-binding protein [Halobacteria archaeon]